MNDKKVEDFYHEIISPLCQLSFQNTDIRPGAPFTNMDLP